MERFKALLVEDDLNWVLYFQETVCKSKYNMFDLDYAEDLGTAIKKLQQEQYSIIFLDLMLPDSQGKETIEAVLNKYPFTAVVILTTLDDGELKKLAMDLGAQDYLVKDEYDENSFFYTAKKAIERVERSQSSFSNTLDRLQKKLENICYIIGAEDC